MTNHDSYMLAASEKPELVYNVLYKHVPQNERPTLEEFKKQVKQYMLGSSQHLEGG